jgi:uncharacterized membrane protein YbhN (UPF0104 family)
MELRGLEPLTSWVRCGGGGGGSAPDTHPKRGTTTGAAARTQARRAPDTRGSHLGSRTVLGRARAAYGVQRASRLRADASSNDVGRGMSAAAPPGMPAALDARHLGRRVIQLAVVGVLVAVAISALPGLGDLRERFGHADMAWIIVAGVVEIASCLAYVVAFRAVFCRRMSWRFSYECGMAEQATNVLLPAGGAGGLALGAWALRQGGMPTEHIARRSVAFFLITSAPNFICAAVLGALLATGVLPGSAPTAATIVLSVLSVAAIALVLSLPRLVSRRSARTTSSEAGGGRIRRAIRSSGIALSDGVRDIGPLLRSRDRSILTGAIGYMAFDVGALAAAFAAFGGAPPFAPLVFAYVVGQLGGLIPIPGGIGGTDGGLIGALVLYGTPLSQAAAAVLAYRAFQLGIPAILGSVAFVQLRRTLVRHPAPAAMCHPMAEPLEITLPTGVVARSRG